MILPQLGIYGWKEPDENLLLSSLLTGDPLLLIGNHGCAKTHVGYKMAQALSKKFLAYDASKAMFEDILGYPNVEKLKHGTVEYVPSPVTIWDKEIVLIDELNRAVPELQSKWLEIIRSRKIMGFNTQVKWVWAAMNPLTYSATNALDEALIGRFAYFLYPPDVLQMEEADRIRVATHINGDDAPSLLEWTGGTSAGSVPPGDVEATGKVLTQLLQVAGQHLLRLREQLSTLPEFLAKFAELLRHESRGEVALDGRRLGFIYRNLLANRAVELAKAEILNHTLPDFVAASRYVVQSSIPVGLNDASVKREEAVHKMEICFDLLSSYFEEEAEITKVNLIYEVLTTPDLMRRVEILLSVDLGEFAASKAWSDLMDGERDISLFAYTALQVETRRPGCIPRELLASLSARIRPESLSTGFIPPLKDDQIEFIDEVEKLLVQSTDLAKLVAIHMVKELVESENINTKTIADTARRIKQQLALLEQLLTGEQKKKGGKAA